MIAGTETMSWRGKYIGWYRITEEILGKLVPPLSDQEIMENVTIDDEFTAPTGQEHLPRNKAKPLPQLKIKLSDTGIELGIIYRNPEQLELLKNIFKETHSADMEKLLKSLQALDPSYETVLYSRQRDEKPMILRKYVSARLDAPLLERLIEETESLRKGGRQIVNNQSVYVPPRSPLLYMTRANTPLDETDYRNALTDIKPLFELLTGVKTQREIISDRLSKPRQRRNMYREFIEALNEARGKDLIGAEKRREINQKWRDNEDQREELMDYLRNLLGQGTSE
ncbi:MAG: hypothetical protein NWF07_14175 [Candidatus Bathyarchaeota archaeon]|nr:hypothetical protein [Candidatus Bathyarchaeota archaeon]